MTETIHIYTDGACSGNPGPGGYGVVMEWVGKPYKKEFLEGYLKTTNNRMELLAVIVALEQLKANNTQTAEYTLKTTRYYDHKTVTCQASVYSQNVLTDSTMIYLDCK